MHRSLSYLLLALAAFQVGVALLLPLVQVGVAYNQASMRLGNTSEGEEIFVLNRQDFMQGRSGQREWWYNGVLYDLKKVEMHGDSAHVTALPDALEQRLLMGFQSLFGVGPSTLPCTNPLCRLLAQLFGQPFLPIHQTWALLPSPLHIARLAFFFQANRLVGFTRIFTPPPEHGLATSYAFLLFSFSKQAIR